MSIDQQYAYPLSLQMGAVTGAVDDLMHGYEHLVQTLPKISDNVKKVHFNTESMAKELEQRTRQIVEGYEYLEGISSSIPSALTSVAEANRKAILDSVQMNDLFNGFQVKEGDFQKQLNTLKAELHSITQERVVNLVFSRDVINDAKRIKPSRSATPLHLRSSRAINQVNTADKGTMNSLPSQKLNFNTPTQSIIIPEYIPPEKRSSKGKTAPTARYVDSSLMVPSMRQGSLPNEIKNIKTTPGMQPVFISSTQQRPLSRTKRQPSQLAIKLEKTQADISHLKDQILLSAKRSDTEKDKSIDKLKAMVENLEKKQHARDEAVVASVQKLVKGTVECISEHLVASRNDFFDSQSMTDDSYQGYRILTVTPKKESPSSPSAVPENVSRQSPPPKSSSPTNMEVEQQSSSGTSSSSSSRNEYYDYTAAKSVVYQLEGDHESGVRWMKSTVCNETSSNQFNSQTNTAMLSQPSNLANEGNYFVYNSRNGRTIVSATQPIPVHRHGSVAAMGEGGPSNEIESLGLEDRLEMITLEGQAADDKHPSLQQKSWQSDEQQTPSRTNYDAGNDNDTMNARVMGYPESNIFIDHKDAFDFSNVRRDPLLRSRVKAVLIKNTAVEELKSDTNAAGDFSEKACIPVELPSEVVVSSNSSLPTPTPAPSINSSLLELIHSLVQSQREDAKETQNMLFTLLKSREEKDNATTDRDSLVDPDQPKGIIEHLDDGDISSTEEQNTENNSDNNEVVEVKHEKSQSLEAARESDHFRTSLGSVLHGKASENRNVLGPVPQETPTSVSISLIEIVRAVGMLQQPAPSQQPFDKDFVQRTVSEGVASGVKEALQKMMLNLPPAPSRHVVRIGESLGGLDQPRGVKHSTIAHDDRERETTYLTPRYFREYAPPVDTEKEDLEINNADSGNRRGSSRPVINSNNTIAVTRSVIAQSDIEKDIVASRTATEKLLLSDESSSWESFSLDRPSELSALLENKEFSDDDRSHDSGSVNSSIAGNQKQKILYRNVATKDIVETFGEGINPTLVTESTGNRVQGEKSATKRGGEFRLKPLVSTVLEHSATDAVMELYEHMDPPSFDSMTSSVVLDDCSDPEDSFLKSSQRRVSKSHDNRDRVQNGELQVNSDSDRDTDELSTTLSSQDMNRDQDSSRSSGSRVEDVTNAADGMMFELLKTLKLRQAKESVMDRSNRRSSSSRFNVRANASSDSLSSRSSSSKIGRNDDNRSIESILVERVGARNSSDSSSSDSDMDRGRHHRPSANNFLFLR